MLAERNVWLLLLLLLLLTALRCQGRSRRHRRCYSPGLQRYFRGRADWTEPPCRRARCRRGRLLLDDCPPLAESPSANCHPKPRREGADFPDCCPTLECHPSQEERPCYAPHLDRHFAVGESWTMPDCSGLATCQEGGSVFGKGCALIAIPPGHPCVLGDGDASLEYPQCCPKVSCRECYSAKLDRFFGPGETWTDTGCIRRQCIVSRDGSAGVNGMPCPQLAPPFANCDLVENSPEADYPDCCPTFRCEGRCFSKYKGRWFSVGDEWTEEDCTKARCVATDQVALLPCGLLAAGPGCQIQEGDTTADYPACCPTVQCQPEKPCFVPELNRSFAVGESWTTPGGCGQATCTEGGGVAGKGCGLIGIPPGYPCGLDDGDDSLEYPQCCPKVVCRECYSTKLDRFFRPGETWTETGCLRNECKMTTRGAEAISLDRCPQLAPPFPDCNLVEPFPDSDYPDCCPTFRCEGRCFSRSKSSWFSVGDEWTEEGCTRASCLATDQVALLPCGLLAPPSAGCELVDGQAWREYPLCCPALRCPGGCFSPALRRWFAAGRSWTEPGCELATCLGTETMVTEQCSLDGVLAGCTVVDGEGAAFPDCCPTVQCDAPY